MLPFGPVVCSPDSSRQRVQRALFLRPAMSPATQRRFAGARDVGVPLVKLGALSARTQCSAAGLLAARCWAVMCRRDCSESTLLGRPGGRPFRGRRCEFKSFSAPVAAACLGHDGKAPRTVRERTLLRAKQRSQCVSTARRQSSLAVDTQDAPMAMILCLCEHTRYHLNGRLLDSREARRRYSPMQPVANVSAANPLIPPSAGQRTGQGAHAARVLSTVYVPYSI